MVLVMASLVKFLIHSFGSDGPIDKIVELAKVPELMKAAAEAISIISSAGGDFEAAKLEIERRKRITQLEKDLASGDVNYEV